MDVRQFSSDKILETVDAFSTVSNYQPPAPKAINSEWLENAVALLRTGITYRGRSMPARVKKALGLLVRATIIQG